MSSTGLQLKKADGTKISPKVNSSDITWDSTILNTYTYYPKYSQDGQCDWLYPLTNVSTGWLDDKITLSFSMDNNCMDTRLWELRGQIAVTKVDIASYKDYAEVTLYVTMEGYADYIDTISEEFELDADIYIGIAQGYNKIYTVKEQSISKDYVYPSVQTYFTSEMLSDGRLHIHYNMLIDSAIIKAEYPDGGDIFFNSKVTLKVTPNIMLGQLGGFIDSRQVICREPTKIVTNDLILDPMPAFSQVGHPTACQVRSRTKEDVVNSYAVYATKLPIKIKHRTIISGSDVAEGVEFIDHVGYLYYVYGYINITPGLGDTCAPVFIQQGLRYLEPIYSTALAFDMGNYDTGISFPVIESYRAQFLTAQQGDCTPTSSSKNLGVFIVGDGDPYGPMGELTLVMPKGNTSFSGFMVEGIPEEG